MMIEIKVYILNKLVVPVYITTAERFEESVGMRATELRMDMHRPDKDADNLTVCSPEKNMLIALTSPNDATVVGGDAPFGHIGPVEMKDGERRLFIILGDLNDIHEFADECGIEVQPAEAGPPGPPAIKA